MVRIWSQPTPACRSASARHNAGAGGGVPSRRSSTTKSLPAPCILVKRSGGRDMASWSGRVAGTATGSTVVVARGRRIDGRVAGRQGLGIGRVTILRRPGIVDGLGLPGLLDLFDVLVIRRRRIYQRALVAAGGQDQGEQQRHRREEHGGSAHGGSVARAAGAGRVPCPWRSVLSRIENGRA